MGLDLKERFIYLVNKHGITAYEMEKHTSLSAVGIQKIIDGTTKNPQKRTLETLISYITNKYNEEELFNSSILKEERPNYDIRLSQLEEKEKIIYCLERNLKDKDKLIDRSDQLLELQSEKIKDLESRLKNMKSPETLSKTNN